MGVALVTKIRTVSGGFDPLNPRPEDVRIEDVARALSRLCRYGGHVKGFWSVAEHSVWVATEVTIRATALKRQPPSARLLALEGLLHDAPEGLGLVDLPSPVKRDARLAGYRLAEEAVRVAVARRFGLPLVESALVKEADAAACEWEMGWVFDKEGPYRTFAERERLFLEAFDRLGGRR